MSPKKVEIFSRALLNKMGVEFTEKGIQISNDGGITVATFAGVEQALSSLQLPIFELDEASLIQTEEFMHVDTLGVSGINFALIENELYVDPTIDEEKIAVGTCTILISHEDPPNIVNIESKGYFPMNEERFSEIFGKATLILKQ